MLLLLLLNLKYLMLVILSKKTKKTEYNTNEIKKKITVHEHGESVTTPGFNKLISKNFAARLAQTNLASKSDIVNFVKKDRFI